MNLEDISLLLVKNLLMPQTNPKPRCKSICDATEKGGMPPVTMTNETTPPPWR